MNKILIVKIIIGICAVLLVVAQVLIYRRVGTMDVSEFHTLSIVELSIICVFAALVLFNLSMYSPIPYTSQIVVLLLIISLITALADGIIKKRDMVDDPTQSNMDNNVIRYSGLISLGLLVLTSLIYSYFEQERDALIFSSKPSSLPH